MFLKPFLISVILLSGARIVTATLYTFTTVDGPTDSSGNLYTVLSGVNNAGTIVGYTGNTDFIYSNGNFGFVDPTNYGNFESINDSGLVATARGIYSSADFEPVQYPDLSFPLSVSVVKGINDSGQVIGYYIIRSYQHGDMWADGFTYLNGVYTSINASRETVGFTYFNGSNKLGQIVGDVVDLNFYGFLYQNGTVTTINAPGAVDTVATGINDFGVIVGNYNNHGFVDVDGGFQDLDVPGASFTYPQAINDAGEIVGYYGEGSSVHGFIAVPNAVATPEGSPTVLLAIGSIAVCGYVGHLPSKSRQRSPSRGAGSIRAENLP